LIRKNYRGIVDKRGLTRWDSQMYKANPGDVSLGSDWDSSMRIGFFHHMGVSEMGFLLMYAPNL
jgi:hypothetical protein